MLIIFHLHSTFRGQPCYIEVAVIVSSNMKPLQQHATWKTTRKGNKYTIFIYATVLFMNLIKSKCIIQIHLT